MATTSTHDIEPAALWWPTLTDGDRAALEKALGLPAAGAAFGPAVRDALLRQVYGSGSDLLLLPIQDVFGWPDRVNVPATVGDQNWTWKLPLSVEALGTDPEAIERAAWLRQLAGTSARR